ncbi:MAG: LssY C-terminal domain-containing protein [Candidatus Sulfopaludibacter sp.]|nr:LssY C-terminal domain-containing protein [Candidatus Sulfopaludibacter sp.]
MNPRRCAVPLMWACLAGGLPGAEPSPGTPVEARLLTPLSTYSAKPGMKVSAAVATPMCAEGAAVLPEGTELRGTVKRVSKVGLGLVHESASLQLEFTQLEFPDGREYAVAARLAAIDNARERVDRKGKIHGIRATATLSNRFGERIAFAVLGHPAAMIPLFVAESAMFHFPDPEIEFHRGTEMHLTVEFPAEFGQVAACPLPEVESSPEEWAALQDTVNSLPYWTFSKRQSQPMDLVNLLFLGSREQVEKSFAAAGWSGSRANSMRAGVAAIRAIVENGSFSEAPMRTLLLEGREPEIRLQKSQDTFEKRDHLRIWKRDGELDGRAVWASAATRDTGTTFGVHPFGFTHAIQNEVDLERDKVVHDLIFTGCVESVAYVERPRGLRDNGEAYRRGISTDGRVAAITLNGCEQPREDFAWAEPFPQPRRAVRFIRRVTLTARNHFIRDNLVYRSADAARLTYLALRQFDRQAREEGRARRMEAAAHRPPAGAPAN